MKILFIGDISGKPGRGVVKDVLPGIREKDKIDFVIANIENAAGGRGVTKKILDEMQNVGIDFFTTGEHVWDRKEFWVDIQDHNLPLTRPYNYEANDQIPGKGYQIIDLGKTQIIIINLLGQVFMRDFVRSPFWAFDELWEKLSEEEIVSRETISNPLVIIDFHAEATSEKICFGWYVKERVSAVLGTHTHVATADTRILDDKCAFVSDVGMCGPLDASLWVDFENVTHNFRFPFKKKFEMKEEGRVEFNSVLIEFNEKNEPLWIERRDFVR